MKRLRLLSLLVLLPAGMSVTSAFQSGTGDTARWQQRANNVTIIRDDWGIAHVYGKTDADAVFGMVYAQAEDDFNRVETNFINAMGRLAEAEGEQRVYQDLRMKLFIDPETLKSGYASSPTWLKALMDAWADCLNFYLSKHPEVKPRVIKRFEPWMALSFTEGSIGGDIERINLAQLEAFYSKVPMSSGSSADDDEAEEPRGSNGIAIAPSNTADHHALLLINPHTSFFFRSELQMVSDAGLNVYGAVTWGQFFVYQGFNARNGWMHTSYGGDAIDEYAETIVKKPDGLYYRYGSGLKKLRVSQVAIPYKLGAGLGSRQFTVYHSHHGPIIRAEQDRWIAIKLLQDPVPALEQSYLRTKTADYAAFRRTQEMRTDTSNNTVYADADGTIA